MTSALKTKPRRAPFDGYDPESFFDEMVAANGEIRPHYARFGELFQNLTKEEFDLKRQSVDLAFMRQGVTFNVYGDSAGTEKYSRSISCPALFRTKSGNCLNAASRNASRP
jgi:uncharacterized circularly permuted ATP-grasp superfamily protein